MAEVSGRWQPDWDRLGRETPWCRDDWIAAAMYLGDLDWRALWPTVEGLVQAAGHSPISAARMVRMSLTSPTTTHPSASAGLAGTEGERCE